MDPDAVWDGSGVGRGMGVLYGGGDHRRGRAPKGQFWGEFGRPIVTNGDFATQRLIGFQVT